MEKKVIYRVEIETDDDSCNWHRMFNDKSEAARYMADMEERGIGRARCYTLLLLSEPETLPKMNVTAQSCCDEVPEPESKPVLWKPELLGYLGQVAANSAINDLEMVFIYLTHAIRMIEDL